MLTASLRAVLIGCLCAAVVRAELERLPYDNPGLMVDLGVGLWAWPLPLDFDGDGDLDLVVNCPDKPSNGVYFFENATGDTGQHPFPVFRPARRISDGLQNVQISYIDQQIQVLTPGKIYPRFLQTGLAHPEPLPLPANVHPNKVRANMWKLVDFDGDGLQDLIIGVGDWTDYGWDNAYDAAGVWQNGPLRGFVYVARNTGSAEKPAYARPSRIQAGNQPIEVFGWPSPNFGDFDQDGDLDLLCGEFLDGFTYFENQGSRTQPVYAAGRRLKTEDGRPLVMDLQMITPTAIDWNRDGWLDLVVGDEDGRVALLLHHGRFSSDRLPIFTAPRYFQQQADTLKFGALATPCGFDWDGDGDDDILCGNTAGQIGIFENLSGPTQQLPKWAPARLLQADRQTIRIQAGPNGSIQGPAEAKWGYTTLTVADWDGDELPDLLVNSIWGQVLWYRNLGPRENPRLAAAQPVEVAWTQPQPHLAYGWLRPDGPGLLTQWRTTPVAVDWNRDQLPDLVMLDHEGYLALFPRALRDGQRILLPPQRVFCDEAGQPLRLNAEQAGRSGRRKLCVVDWDHDGDLDLIVNSENAQLYRQVSTQAGRWLFRREANLAQRPISSHTTSPTTVDFDRDGKPELLIGAEDGRLYYLQADPN
jgi:hypothetical protein